MLTPESTVELIGRGPAAGIALYAGIFEPAVSALKLSELSDSHRDGPILIDVLRVLDVPQALALVFPRKVTLATADPGGWTWAEDVARLYGDPSPLTLEPVTSEAN